MAGFFFEDLVPGQKAELVRTVTGADIDTFAAVTGDDNPVHLDEAFAATTPFGTRVAHGMLSAGYISALLGTILPGNGAIYLSQSLKFLRPVRPGDAVHTEAEVLALDSGKGRVTLRTWCRVNGKVVVDGEAIVLVPRRPAASPAQGPVDRATT